MKIELQNNELDKEIEKGLVLVDFFATWCGPCRMQSGVLDEVIEETKIKLVKIDVDKNEIVAKQYGIMSIPTIILFKDGIVLEKRVGLTSKEQLIKLIEENK
ncbi:MAG: thioredoxin [Bacilli bacterium]|nr:thioredoxin [Bacilli bacterium]